MNSNLKYAQISVFLCLINVMAFAQGSLSESGKSPKQLIKSVKKGKAYLIDVRTPEEYNSGHLKFAQNIDFRSAEFKATISKLDKTKTVYLYCRSGNRSGKSVDTLKTLGFTHLYNIGGLSNLTISGLALD